MNNQILITKCKELNGGRDFLNGYSLNACASPCAVPTTIYLKSQNQQTQTKLYPYLDIIGKLISEKSKKSTFAQQLSRENPAYRSLLEETDQYWKIMNCLKVGETYQCPHGHLVYKPTLCKNPKICVNCGQQYTKKQSAKIKEIFNSIHEKVDGVRVTDFVFTVPKQLWKLIDYTNYNRFLRCCKKTIQKYFYGLPCGISNFHHWHSKNPMAENYPHIHLNSLNIVFVKNTPMVVRFDIDLKKMRQLYKENLEQEFDVEISKINIHYEHIPIDDKPYHKNKKITNNQKIWHKLKYNFRMPQLDVNKFSNKHQISLYSDQQKNAILKLINPPKNFKRTRWFGWLADGVRTKYLKLLDVEIVRFDKSHNRRVMCPVHNCECEHLENFVKWSDIQNEKGIVVDYGNP